MMIWILGLLLIASVAALGYRQGAIKVGFSFFGILVGALVAVPLGRLASKLIGILGVKDPLLLWALGPILVFIVVSAAFKVGAAAVHQKVDVYYKYRTGELRMLLWERLNRRLGACLGVLNGVAYAILLAFAIYVPSYATLQVASSEEDPKWMRFLNVLGRDLHKSGMDKVARSIDRIPDTTYQMVDLTALLYRNGLLQARLGSYPAFLALSELPEFSALAANMEFTQSWLRMDPFMRWMENPGLQNIRRSPDLLKTLWNTTKPDLADLQAYLRTGRSAKYDETKILGRWRFDVAAAIRAVRRAKPTISSREMQATRLVIEAAFGKTSMVARPDNSVTLREIPGMQMPAPGAAATPTLQTLQGQWKEHGENYQISISGSEVAATVENDRLTIKGPGMDLVFNRAE